MPNLTRNSTALLAHGACSSLAEISLLALGLCDTLAEDLSIFVSSILGLLSITAFECDTVALVLETLGSDQTLDLWGLGVWLLSLTLRLNLSANDEFTDIVILGETEELSDLRGTLGTKSLWCNNVCDAGDICFALLDDAESENGKVHSYDATTDGFTLALSGSAWSVAGVALREEETDTSWVHDTLLHRETLLVIASGDLEDVSLEFIADAVTWDLSAHTLLHEGTELSLIFDLNQLLRPICWVRDVELHPGG